MTASDFPTDDLGMPNGRNYHYEIPLNDDEALKKLRFARWKGRDFTNVTDNSIDNGRFGYLTIKTFDRKNHIKGLSNYAKSPQWIAPFGPGKWEDLEAKANGNGGSKVKGTVPMFDEYGHEYRLGVEFDVSVSPSDLENMDYGDDEHEAFSDALHWATEDALEAKREAEYQAQQECDHERAVRDENSSVSHTTGERVGDDELLAWCEDCGHEWVEAIETNSDSHDSDDSDDSDGEEADGEEADSDGFGGFEFDRSDETAHRVV
jgi:hypothetical protein